MVMWVVKGGQRGELDREEHNLANGVATLGWAQLPDLAAVASEAEAREIVQRHLPIGNTEARIRTWATVVRSFATQIKVGDLIAMPLKGRGLVAFGNVTEAYRYDSGMREDRVAGPHRIGLRWGVPVATDDLADLNEWLPRSLRGGRQTVYHLRPQDLEGRIRSELLVFPPGPTAPQAS